MRCTVPALLVCLTRQPVAHAQPPPGRRVVITVSDSATHALLPNVRIARESVTVGVTDLAGRAAFSIAATDRRLTLTRLGYQPRTLTLPERSTDSLELSAIMTAIPQQLAPVDVRDSATEFVSPRLVGFERRRKTGRGTFMTRETIEKKNHVRTNMIDPTEIHGIEVYSGPATIPAEFATTARDAFCGMVLIWTRSRD